MLRCWDAAWQVYLAEQSDFVRQVAVKVLKSDLPLDETQEAIPAKPSRRLLSHASIVQIYEVGCPTAALHRPGVRPRAESAAVDGPQRDG